MAILLIASANVINLLLARGVAREHEFAVRAALGGTRYRLAGLLLLESMIIAALGAVAAVGIGAAIWRAIPIVVELPPLPPFFAARTLLILVAISTVTLGLIGLYPAWSSSRSDLKRLLNSTTSRIAQSIGGRRLLVSAQFALSVTLLIAAGLLLRSFQEIARLDVGYDTGGLVIVSPSEFGSVGADFWESARSYAERRPGVQDVALGVNEEEVLPAR